MVDRLVAFMGRWRWQIVAGWVVGLGVVAIVSAPLPSLLSGGGWSVAGSDSALVESALKQGFVGRGPSSVTIVVHDQWYSQGQTGFDRRVRRVMDGVAATSALAVDSRVGYSTSRGQLRDRFVGKDSRTAVDVLGLRLEDGTARRILPKIQTSLTERYRGQGLDVSLVGTASFWGEVNQLSEEGLARAELLTLPLIVLVLLMLYGGSVAALASLSVGVTAIMGSFGVLTVLARTQELSLFVENTATMLGLGVGVDYSLFVIARFKEELARGRTVDGAIAATLRTSGETVLFSGVTVVAAMSTLFLVPLGVISSIALGAVVVVAFSILSSLLLLPVLLRILGHRINRGQVRLPGFLRRQTGTHRLPQPGRWQRIAASVMRKPVLFLSLGLAFLLLLASPAAGLTTFTPDAQIVPPTSAVRAGFDQMERQFGVGSTAPIRVLLSADKPLFEGSQPGAQSSAGRQSGRLQPGERQSGRLQSAGPSSAAIIGLADRISALPSVDRVDSPLPVLAQVSRADAKGSEPGVAAFSALAPAARAKLPVDLRAFVGHYVSSDARRLVLEVVPTQHAADASTQALLTAIRQASNDAHLPGVHVRVGGETAEGVASNAVIQDRLPSVIAVMLAVIYLLLMVTFRSLLLPLKAILMNLVSVAATFGVLVLVFQHGAGAGLLGVTGAGYIQNFVPILLLALLFSLSTDYEVFLLNRVREEYRISGDNTASVARAMAGTAPLISGAALLMVVVFGAFALAGILPIKQLGLGMAVAIALDATVVRLILVPAAMRLMGRWNWWMPGRRTPSYRPAIQEHSEGSGISRLRTTSLSV